jgi:hypothetical protein
MTSLNEFRLNDYIQHMLQAIQRIEEYIEEHTEDYFLNTPILQDAVVRKKKPRNCLRGFGARSKVLADL